MIFAGQHTGCLAQGLLELASRRTAARKGSLMLARRGQLVIASYRGIDAGVAQSYRGRIGEGVAGRVAARKVPVLARDIFQDSRFEIGERGDYRTGSCIICPIQNGSRLLGLLNLSDPEGRPFNRWSLLNVRRIAEIASLLLDGGAPEPSVAAVGAKCRHAGQATADVLAELRHPLSTMQGAVYFLMQAQHLRLQQRQDFYELLASEISRVLQIAQGREEGTRC